jgi:hypothetical protein
VDLFFLGKAGKDLFGPQIDTVKCRVVVKALSRDLVLKGLSDDNQSAFYLVREQIHQRHTSLLGHPTAQRARIRL